MSKQPWAGWENSARPSALTTLIPLLDSPHSERDFGPRPPVPLDLGGTPGDARRVAAGSCTRRPAREVLRPALGLAYAGESSVAPRSSSRSRPGSFSTRLSSWLPHWRWDRWGKTSSWSFSTIFQGRYQVSSTFDLMFLEWKAPQGGGRPDLGLFVEPNPARSAHRRPGLGKSLRPGRIPGVCRSFDQ